MHCFDLFSRLRSQKSCLVKAHKGPYFLEITLSCRMRTYGRVHASVSQALEIHRLIRDNDKRRSESLHRLFLSLIKGNTLASCFNGPSLRSLPSPPQPVGWEGEKVSISVGLSTNRCHYQAVLKEECGIRKKSSMPWTHGC